jgi:uncharacterized membrane protein
MVIMALDHVRDFFHETAMTHNPLDLQTTTPALYFARWITHLCAPVFVFLAGTSAYLFGLRRSKSMLSAFLIKRGLWLIAIEILVVTLGWSFNPFYNIIILQVIWAIGISMVILGLLIRLPFPVIFTIGLIIVFGHNLLDPLEKAKGGQVGFLWDLIHHAMFSFYTLWDQHFVIIVYAFLPWTGIMLLGYCFGKLYHPDFDPSKRKSILVLLGLGAILLFIVLRLINRYGDPFPWSPQRNAVYTFLSFMNVHKYPPSLMFTCVTLGPALLFLSVAENIRGLSVRIFTVYGRVPFFYYVLHLYLIHAILVVVFFLSGYTSKDIVPPQSPFLFRPNNFGFSLWGVYGIWVLVVVLLYPVCRWYNRYKSTHHNWWLSYL